MMQNKDGRSSQEFQQRGGEGLMITSVLGLSWVVVPLGLWSLAKGRRGPAGNWSRPALEARWRKYFLMY